MNLNQVIGIVALGIGLFDLGLYLRYRRGPELERWFRKLAPMRERFGMATGTTLHVAAYVVLPLVAGAVLLWRG